MVPLNKSVICPVLVGRGAQLATIARLCDDVQSGTGRVVLLAGEAGLGKSRLASQVAATLRLAEWQVLQGACGEYETTISYAPLIDMLRRAMLEQGGEQLVARLGAESRVLTALLPELMPPALPGATHDPQRLLPALVHWWSRLATPHGLLVIIEDLHWCDEASLELLLSLVRFVPPLRLLLLITYRSNEVNGAVERCLAQLDRSRITTEIALTPLKQHEIGTMLRAIFEQAQPVRTEFLEPLYTLTEGNPFFVEETLKAMLAAGEIFYDRGTWDRKPLHELHIPRSVGEAVQRQSERLSPPARELLTLAAVIGRRFAFPLLQQLTGWPESDVLIRIKELLTVQFIVEENADQFAFRHALIRQAVYQRLLARERRQLHRTISESLLAGKELSPAVLSELAYHCFAGEWWEQALIYTRRAAEDALKLFAPATALIEAERASEASRRLGHPPDPALLLLRGRAQLAVSNGEAARADLEMALRLAQETDAPYLIWQALVALGELGALHDYRPTGEYFAQALQQARILNEPTLIAASLNHLGNWHMNQERPFEARQFHSEALALFEAQGDQDGIVQTLDLLGITSTNCGDLLAGRAYFDQALAHWRMLEDRRGLIHTLSGMALGIDFRLDICPTPLSMALTFAEEAVQASQYIGWRSGETLALICRGLVLKQQANYPLAYETLELALKIAIEIEHRGWLTDSLQSFGSLHLELLAYETARPLLEQALEQARALNALLWVHHVSGALAFTCVRQGDFARAQELIATIRAPFGSPGSLGERLVWAAEVERALAAGETAHALALVEWLIATTTHLAAQPDTVVPYLWLIHGQALAASGQFEEAERRLSAAQAAARASGYRGLLWRIQAELASVVYQLGQPRRAAEEVASGQELINALAAELREHQSTSAFAQQFLERSSALLPDRDSMQQRLLTAREVEVAALVAEGKTNREIANALVLSERTVERHVANIMLKLDVHTRAQIAVWVVQHL